MNVIAGLFEGTDLPSYNAGRYGAGDVARMRDNLAATNPSARLTVVADEAHYDAVAALEGVTARRMKGIGCGGWTPLFECFMPPLWPAPGERHLFVGLDTVFMGDIGWLFDWDKAPVGLPLDPIFDYRGLPCDAVVSFNMNGAAIIYRAYCEAKSFDGMRSNRLGEYPSEMVLMRRLYAIHGWPPLEAEHKRLLSWRIHVRDGGRSVDEASIVYFHGKEKQDDLPADDPVRRAWQSTRQPA